MAWRIRLEAQDTALSRLRHGFESRMRYQQEKATGNPVAFSFDDLAEPHQNSIEPRTGTPSHSIMPYALSRFVACQFRVST